MGTDRGPERSGLFPAAAQPTISRIRPSPTPSGTGERSTEKRSVPELGPGTFFLSGFSWNIRVPYFARQELVFLVSGELW